MFFSVANLLNLEVDVIFFDTTSTYFERRRRETRRARAAAVLGHSKDHRPDLPQVVIGLAVTREGIPVRVWVWPGNSNDQTLVEQVKARPGRLAARPRDLRSSTPASRAEDNLASLPPAARPLHRRDEAPLRDAGDRARAGAAGPLRTVVRDNLGVKDVKVGDGDAAVRYVVCHNPAEADDDRARRRQQLDRIDDGARPIRRSA